MLCLYNLYSTTGKSVKFKSDEISVLKKKMYF